MPGETRTITKADYKLMYQLLEKGTPRAAICEAWGISDRTLYARITKDRPDLIERVKQFPTSKQVAVTMEVPLEKIIEGHGRRMRGGAAKLIAHDIDVLADEVDKQNAAIAKDPNKERTLVAMPHAKNLKALFQVAGSIAGTGVESSGAKVTVNNTMNHATIMRVDGEDIFADDIPEDAFIELEDASEE